MHIRHFTLPELQDALSQLGIAHRLTQQRPTGRLHFCSYFAQEAHGIYFWEGDEAPRFDSGDIVVIAGAEQALSNVACRIEVAHPQLAYYRLMAHFFAPPPLPGSRIHASAIVDPRARLGADVQIGPYCVIGDCEIGDGVQLDSHVVVKDGSSIGHRVRIEAHSTIGATGVAWLWDPQTGERVMQPQIGGTRIGNDCFLGTDITVVRGSVNEVTSLGDGCVVAHGTKIGHGCVIGAEVHFANNVSIAGNCRIGDRAFLSAASVLRPRVQLARGVTVGAGAVVTKDVGEEGVVVSGVPARKMDGKSRHAGIPKAINS